LASRLARAAALVVELISYEGAAIEPAPWNEHFGYRMITLEVDDMQNATDYLKTKGVEIDVVAVRVADLSP
jgi:hypothetical protein